MRSLGQAAITLDMAPPRLVVEVVSPGQENHRRDYREKRNQYEWRGIPEYWICRPRAATGRSAVSDPERLPRKPSIPQISW